MTLQTHKAHSNSPTHPHGIQLNPALAEPLYPVNFTGNLHRPAFTDGRITTRGAFIAASVRANYTCSCGNECSMEQARAHLESAKGRELVASTTRSRPHALRGSATGALACIPMIVASSSNLSARAAAPMKRGHSKLLQAPGNRGGSDHESGATTRNRVGVVCGCNGPY